MKNLFFAGCLILSTIVKGEDTSIKDHCLNVIPSTENSCNQTEISDLLEAFQNKYKDEKARADHGQEEIQALDEIILQSPFSYIVQCRDKLIKEGAINYKTEFLDPKLENQEMSVENSMISKDVTLRFSTKKSAQNILMVYLHELTHVCQNQRLKKLDLEVRLNNSEQNKMSYEELNRYQFLQEIEAFYNQQKTYRFFTGVSKRFCNEESNFDPEDPSPLYESYIGTEASLSNGYFAQSIIYAYYFDLEPEIKKAAEESMFKMDKTTISYSDPGLQVNEGKFTLPLLNEEMKTEISELGIEVLEKPNL